MSNHSGTSAIPAVDVLIENAKIGFGVGAVKKLLPAKMGDKVHDLSLPTISKILGGEELYTRRTAEILLFSLVSRIKIVGGHECTYCNYIADFNCRLINFGPVLDQVQSRRENQSISVVEQLSIHSQITQDVIENHMRGKTTLPRNIVDHLLKSCHAIFGQYLETQSLYVKICVPRICSPPDVATWTAINRSHVHSHCGECRAA